ncbi:hypothetical protein LCGC14_2521970, partial [marine sediment metagenome]
MITKEEGTKILMKENIELKKEVRNLKRELRNIKKENIYCHTCKKHIGFYEKKKGYDILDGVIQHGKGKGI